jgi:hypothetical protein
MNATQLERQRIADLMGSLTSEPETALCDYDGRTQELLPLIVDLMTDELDSSFISSLVRAALNYDAQEVMSLVQREIRLNVSNIVACELPDPCQREVERIAEQNLGQYEERAREAA